MTTATYDAAQRYAENVSLGDELTPQQRRPTTVQLFRYCAVTWNSHRIHYDKDYAASEGYPDVLVQSHLHGAYLTSLCTHFAGEEGNVERLSYSVRRFATPGDVLNVSGTVTEVEERDRGAVFHLDVREVRAGDEAVCASGEAEVFLPWRPTTADGRTS